MIQPEYQGFAAMSIDCYNLRLPESYDLATVAFQLARFRALLRKEREKRIGGRDRLAERAGVASSTVQTAEMGPDIPGIDTVARLIEAMPNLSLSEFFRQLEDGAKPAISSLSNAPPVVLESLTEGPPVETLRQFGEIFLAAAAHAKESRRATSQTRRTRIRKR